MIGYFPALYPDELLYSACARYSSRMQFPNKSTAALRFFGKRGVAVVVDLPSGIDHLTMVIPQGHKYTADRFIKDHTLEPFYAAFLPPGRLRAIQNEMRTSESNHIYTRLGMNIREFKRPSHLRFCPVCVRHDRRQFGETYWHRIHQVDGVEVCPQHEVFLESSAQKWEQRNSGNAIPADPLLTEIPARPLTLPNTKNAVLLKIAKDAAWLLEWRGATLGNDVIRQRYHNLLLEHGYAYYNGRIRTTKLINAFTDFYSPEFLADMQCHIKKQDQSWLLQLVHVHKATVVQHPVHHLLLMTFLGVTAKDFFTSFREFKPFDEGPWPCLNRASKHFGELLIEKCCITDNIVKKKKGRPLGIFECKCGFIYQRVGPDTSPTDRYRVDSVQSYGHAWESLLRKSWHDLSLTVQSIAESLGVSHLTVTRHAIRLKLPMNTAGSRMVSKKLIRQYRETRPTRIEALKKYRSRWLSFRRKYPEASRKVLMSKANSLYLWLRRNDSEWLEANLPPTQKTPPRANRLDWQGNDLKLSTLLREAVSSIKDADGRPTRVSLAAIIRKIGHRGWIENYRDKLPLSAIAIEECVESPDDFSIRRVIWARDCYVQEGLCPTRHQLIVFAGIRTKAGKSAKVQSIIDITMERLQNRFRYKRH
jgi:Tn7-like transposition protein D/TniQ